MKTKNQRFCLGVWNCDTESTVEGYVSAFMANRFQSRLVRQYPISKKVNPSKRWLNLREAADKLIDNTLSERIRFTQQSEIKSFAQSLQDIAERVADIYCKMDSALDRNKINVYWILHFANLAWDYDVLKGIIFDSKYKFDCVGQYSDLIQFSCGHLYLRDFLRTSGFASIKMAGMICTSAKKLDGTEVYNLKLKDVPSTYDEYSEDKKAYMENDVAVMDEALNIILNRKENMTIRTYNDLPMTSTGFGRWRYSHNPEITVENGKEVNVAAQLTMFRWRYARPYILYLMRSYKGGYCGPNPHIQYQILHNVICKDAVSMYPHKMLFFEMMQANRYTKMFECPYTLEECEIFSEESDIARSALYRVKNIYDYLQTLDNDGLMTIKPDDHLKGICPWIGTIELTIKGVREYNNIKMMPFLSKHKLENKPKNMVECNGKILQGENIIMVMSSIDLMLTILCYECEIIHLHKWLTLSWRSMLPIQKRDLWEAYKRKMHISKVLKRNRYDNNDYWQHECGFDPALINALSDEEYMSFTKAYKMFAKVDANSKYGMTVEKPIHPITVITEDENGLPEFETESISAMNERVYRDVMGNTPNYVKASDYCAGASVTMWARWQLITMMYCLFVHGIETYYCDTDSLFVPNCEQSEKCFALYNQRLKEYYYSTETGNETVTIDSSENLGQFETDKECDIFRTLGAKNYGYIKGNKIKLTVAGLRTKDFEANLTPENFKRYFRPNIFILPFACHKLLKDTANMGFDDKGLWRGPILTGCGFAMCDMMSKFHINNAIQAALSQDESPAYYLGEFDKPLYLSDRGFSDKSIKKKVLYESFEAVEDRQPIPKGVV